MMSNLYTPHLPKRPLVRPANEDAYRAGDILAGQAHPLPMPAAFNVGPSWPATPSSGASSLVEHPIWKLLYARYRGYEMAWGDILEEADGGVCFHFVPTALIEKGARSDIMAAIAIQWFESRQPLFDGYVTRVDGPPCVPLSVKGSIAVVHQWLAQVFLPTHFEELYRLWEAAISRTIDGAESFAALGQIAPAALPIPVYVIHRPIEGTPDRLELILMTSERGGCMRYAMWTRHEGVVLSDWISLRDSYVRYLSTTTDFLLDFYRTAGYVISETCMPMHEPAVDNLIAGLIARGCEAHAHSAAST
jgi:hypothetical protein